MIESVSVEEWNKIYNSTDGLSRYPHDSVVRWTIVNFKNVLNTNPKFLDLGCGGGRHSIFLAQLGCNVSAIDYSSNAIDIAKKWADKENLNINFDVCAATTLPYEDSVFDGIISYGVFCYLSLNEIKQSIIELNRVLKPGGKLFLVTRTTEDSRYLNGGIISANQAIVTGDSEVPWQTEIGMKMLFMTKSDITKFFKVFNSVNIEHQSFTMCSEKYINDDWIISATK